MKNSHSAMAFALLTSCATIVGVAIRIHFAAEPLWIDELHTAWSIDSGIGDVAHRAGQGNQTPLYFWLSWLGRWIPGCSEFVLRLPSVVFSAATIVMAASFVWRFTGDPIVSGTTAWLVATDSWFVFYGTEARPYALLQLLSILQFGYLALVLERDNTDLRHWLRSAISWPLMLLTAALIATHLTAIFLVVAELLFVFEFGFARTMNRRRIGLSLILACLVLVPLLPIVLSAFEKRADWKQISDNKTLVRDAAPGWLVYVVAPTLFWMGYKNLANRTLRKQDSQNPSRSDMAMNRITTSQAMAQDTIPPAPSVETQPEQVCGPLIALTLVCGMGPLIMVWLLELTGMIPMAAYRYTLVGSIALPIFAGLVISRICAGKLQLAFCLILLLLAGAANPMARSWLDSGAAARFRGEDWESAIEQLEQNPITADQPVFLFPNLVEDHRAKDMPRDSPLFVYLTFPLTGIYRHASDFEVIPMPTQASERWNWSHLKLIRQCHGARIIARVSKDQMQTIVNELQELAIQTNVNVKYVIHSQSGNDVRIAFISCEN